MILNYFICLIKHFSLISNKIKIIYDISFMTNIIKLKKNNIIFNVIII